MGNTSSTDQRGRLLRNLYMWGVGFPLAMTGAATITGLQFVTAGRARGLCANQVLPLFSKSCLFLMEVDYRVHGTDNIPDRQAVYISNHPSFLDLFLMASVGLPNLRSFLSEDVLKYLPIKVIGKSLGYFFTPAQAESERRIACFQNAAKVLKKSGDSIFVTPQGERRPDEIGHFNKGAFHLAMDLGVPIVPIFIDTPKDINPGMEITSTPGRIEIFIDPPVDTSSWRLEDLTSYPEDFRKRYEAFPDGWSSVPA